MAPRYLGDPATLPNLGTAHIAMQAHSLSRPDFVQAVLRKSLLNIIKELLLSIYKKQTLPDSPEIGLSEKDSSSSFTNISVPSMDCYKIM